MSHKNCEMFNKNLEVLPILYYQTMNTMYLFSFNTECVKEVKSLMWMYVLVGNIIRGIGETPIMPLGISYIEDFAKSENSPLYIGEFENLP